MHTHHAHTGVGSGGMQGSDTLTIYVGDIDMYIPQKNLTPSHANCMQHVLRCWESNLTAQNTRKPFGGRGSALDPTEGAYNTPGNPLVGGEGLTVPSPRTRSPDLGPSSLASPTPTLKLVPTPLHAHHLPYTHTHSF